MYLEYVPAEQSETGSVPDPSKEEEPVLNVHSANKWEKAELGDTGRKNKFLRLMGAARVRYCFYCVIHFCVDKSDNVY